ncbi:MAG TPA: LysM domain-containing protein, partial [Candidatus Nanoperiomorbaceae bacterium]|nr:LysM domain-containing protein [Candidatus Nanoperiomorbaceae bacterium]
MVLLFLAYSGYKSPSVKADKSQTSSLTSSTAVSAASNVTTATVDAVQAASLAANVADTANLSVSGSVSEQSVSASTSAELEQHESATINKPQITDPTAKVELISSYTAVAGDTAASIAAKFGVSEQTIRWANN